LTDITEITVFALLHALISFYVWHNLPSGGGKRQLYTHIKGLLKQGHYAEAWCPDTADQTFLPLNKLIVEHIIPLKFPIIFNRQSIYEIIKNYNTVKILSEAIDEHNKECARQINDGDFDVLFANSCSFFRTTSIGKYIKLPTAIYIGEPYRWFYEAMPELAWLTQISDNSEDNEEKIKGVILQARYELNCAKEYDLILTNSIFSRETILRTYNLESKVCYLGIDTDFYKPVNQNKENFVVGLGTIYHAKGVDRAIKALGTIPNKIRPDLIWIGNGAWPNDLSSYCALAQELNVNFITKINISHDEVKSLLSSAALMIYTSRLEPFGLAPLEANACGTPVIAIAEGGVKETIVDGINGYLVSDDSPKRIGNKIIATIDDKKKLKDFSNTCRKQILTRWNLDNCASNLEYYLYNLINKKRMNFFELYFDASDQKREPKFVNFKHKDTRMSQNKLKPKKISSLIFFKKNLQDMKCKFWLKKTLPPIFVDIYRLARNKGYEIKKLLPKNKK